MHTRLLQHQFKFVLYEPPHDDRVFWKYDDIILASSAMFLFRLFRVVIVGPSWLYAKPSTEHYKPKQNIVFFVLLVSPQIGFGTSILVESAARGLSSADSKEDTSKLEMIYDSYPSSN